MRTALVASVAVIGTIVAATGAPRAAHAGDGRALLRYVPDTATTIIVVDFAHARAGGGAGRLAARLAQLSARWSYVGAHAQLDAAIDTVVFASYPGTDGTAHAITIVDGDLAALMPSLRQQPAPPRRPGTVRPADVATETYAGAATWTVDHDQLAAVDHHLVITGAGEVDAAIDRSHARLPSASTSSNASKLRAVLAAIAGSGVDVWGGFVLSDDLRNEIAQGLGGAAPSWFAFGIGTGERTALTLRIQFDDASTAEVGLAAIRTLTNPDGGTAALAFIGPEFTDSLVIERRRSLIELAASMSNEESDRLADLVRQWM